MKKLIFIIAGAFLMAAPTVPAIAAAPKFVTPAPLKFTPPTGTKHVLDNGLTVWLLEDHTLPMIRAFAIIKAGSLYDTKDKIGLSDITAETLRLGGTKKYPADKLNEALEATGSSIESDMSDEFASASMFSLTANAPEVMAMFADMLQNPAFEPAKVEILRAQYLESLLRRNDSPNSAANREGKRRFFGPDSPFGWREESGTINAITLDDINGYYNNYYKPDGVVLCITGDFKSAEMLTLVSGLFNGWSGKAAPLPSIPAPQTAQARKVYYAEKVVENAPVRIYQPGPARFDPDYYTYTVTNEIFGGSGLSSRLFSEVRTAKGLAYSVYSTYNMYPQTGVFMLGVGTKNQTVPDATRELLRQMEALRTAPPSAKEMALAQNGIVNSFVFRFTTPMAVLQERTLRTYLGFPADYIETFTDKIKAVTAQDTLTFSKKWIKPENAMIFVLGDKSKFSAPLDEFGPVTTVPLD